MIIIIKIHIFKVFIPVIVFLIMLSSMMISPVAVGAADSGWLNPTANTADSGGDGNGFEIDPTKAFSNGDGRAQNINGAGDRHRFYNYGFNLPTGAGISGIEVRLDWWLDSTFGTSQIAVALSWDGGTSWTSEKADSTETTYEHTVILGSVADNWGRTWSVNDFTNSNFKVRVNCISTSNQRDVHLDWIPVRVSYTAEITPPTGSVIINNGMVSTNTTRVDLGLSAQDDKGVNAYRIANGNDASGGEIVSVTPVASYSAVVAWALSAWDGEKTVSVQYRNISGNWSDNCSDSIILDTTSPSVTINQAAGQMNPTSEPTINYTVIFSEAVHDFATGDVSLSGAAGATYAVVTGSGTTYNVAVSGMVQTGTVIAAINSSVAHDASGNPNAASISTDNSVFFQVTHIITASAGNNGSIDHSGTVSVNHGASQSFSISPVSGYHVADVLVDGSSVGAVTGYTFTNVTADHSIQASFAADVVVPAWDLNADHVCDITDIQIVGNVYGQTGTPGWIPADVVQDGIIDISDIQEMGNHYGMTW